MRILFVFKQENYIRTFGSALRHLHNLGHDVRVACDDPVLEVPEGLEDLTRVIYLPIESGDRDRWHRDRSLVRHMRDYLRYLDPEFRETGKLRARAFAKLLRTADAPDDIGWPADAALGLDDRLRARLETSLGHFEELLPPDPGALALLRAQEPDVVLVSPLVNLGSGQADYIKAARSLGIPSGMILFSWDNLSTKGRLHVVPDRVFVWNKRQVREAMDLHGVPAGQVVVTGAARFDTFCELVPSMTREEFCVALGFDPAKRTLTYLCSSPLVSGHELDFVREWIAAVRGSDDPAVRDSNILVRPHPDVRMIDPGTAERARWHSVPGKAVVARVFDDPRAALVQTSYRIPQAFFECLYHADAIVGLNTSAEIEAGIAGRPVFTIRADASYADGQQDTIHFHYLLKENGGFVRPAASLAEHVTQLSEEAAAPTPSKEIRRFVGAFIRPLGWDVSAGEQIATAVLRELTPSPMVPAQGVGEVEVETPVGRFWVDPSDQSLGKRLLDTGVYEPGWTAWAKTRLTPGMRILDVGGNIGYYSVLFAQGVGATGHVMAFEPDARNRQLLERNLVANAVRDFVTVVPAAVSEGVGSVILHRDPQYFGVHSLAASNCISGDASEATEVPTVSLDSAVNTAGWERVDLIKIDAQGAEGLILKGATAVLAQAKLTLMIELWPAGLASCGSSLDEVLTRLEQAGFQPFFLSKKAPTLKPATWEDLRNRGARIDHKWGSFNAAFVKGDAH